MVNATMPAAEGLTAVEDFPLASETLAAMPGRQGGVTGGRTVAGDGCVNSVCRSAGCSARIAILSCPPVDMRNA